MRSKSCRSTSATAGRRRSSRDPSLDTCAPQNCNRCLPVLSQVYALWPWAMGCHPVMITMLCQKNPWAQSAHGACCSLRTLAAVRSAEASAQPGRQLGKRVWYRRHTVLYSC